MSNQTTEHHDHSLALAREMKELTAEITRLKKMDFMQVFNHPVKFLFYSFMKGLMIGFGSVLGASVLVGIFIYVLAQIRLVPILGDFVQEVINQIQTEQSVKPSSNIKFPTSNSTSTPSTQNITK
ncbi:MAG: DUF5665 domain-containing protein [Candidatus Peregrinibacteria bacterium]|nr:DUF5665 domain-containing protein [Candidatus Peregrinibacteria bacterium]